MLPAYLSADGGEAEHVDTVDGCEVWAVRRKYSRGGDHRPADVIARDPGPHYYWTPVVQTAPGRAKAMAFVVPGDRSRFREREACIDAIREQIAYDREQKAATLAQREATRAAARTALALVRGTMADRVADVAEAAREALVYDAMAQAAGNRSRAAEILGVPQERVTEWMRRYPWIAERWPAQRGRPAQEKSDG